MKFSILVNDSLVCFFNNSHGLRQGDPLSPLLLVIVMEVFSRMISALVNSGFVDGFLVGDTNRGSFNITHLLFTNDTLICCEVEQN